MKVAINRRQLAERFLLVIFKHPSIEEIIDSDGEHILVPIERYEDLCHDIGVLLGHILQDIAFPVKDE